MARRSKQRVQVEDPLRRLPDQKVRPLAPDVFVGAPGVSGAGAGMADIADALSGFAGTVGGLHKVRQAAEKERQEQVAKEFELLPRQEKIDRLQRGYRPDGVQGNPAVSKLQGEAQGQHFVDELSMKLEQGEFDYINGGDVDKYIFDLADPVRKTLAHDRPAMAGFDGEVRSLMDRQMKVQAERRQEHQINVGKDAVFTAVSGTLRKAKEAGITKPEEQQAAILKTIKVLKDGELKIGIPPAAFDDQIMALSDKIADSDPELAVKLIADPRVGANGEIIGPIGSKRENLEKTEAILKRANTAMKKATVERVTDIQATAILQAGIGGANLGSLDDFVDKHADGTELKVSKEDLKKAVFEKWKVRSAEIKERAKEDDAATVAREVQELSRMGLVNEEWKGLFKGFSSGLTEDAFQDPEKRAELEGIATLYDNIRAHSPYFVSAHMDKATGDILDRYWVARNRLGVKAQDQALLMAQRSGDPESATDFASASRLVKDKLTKDYGNGSTYSRYLRETANGYVRMGGVSPEKAIELAKENASTAGATINGHWVEIPRNPATQEPIVTPDGFDELAEQAIEKWYDLHGDTSSYRASDLTLQSAPNGVYQIVDKRTGVPVIGVNLDGASTAVPMLTMKDFIQLKQEKEAADLGVHVKEQNINQLIRQGKYGEALAKDSDDSFSLKTLIPFYKLITRKSFWLSGGGEYPYKVKK